MLRPWHKLRLNLLKRQIAHQREELDLYIEESEREIADWKQELDYLRHKMEFHKAELEDVAAMKVEGLTLSHAAHR